MVLGAFKNWKSPNGRYRAFGVHFFMECNKK
jgi:hypothetical protein